jgi:GNAT superfamily N-acetyltransferase
MPPHPRLLRGAALTAPVALLRAGRDADAEGFIALIGACWSEYPGIVFDVDGELPELRALASHYTDKGGALWAAEVDGDVVGMIAVAPLDDADGWEIGRLYVLPAWRGGGLAHRLLDTAEAYARDSRAGRLALWSDTRFDRAHRFYEKRGYRRDGPIRVLNDKSNTLEFGYAKPLSGLAVETLDAAGAASAERALADILRACVADGAAVSFLPPLAMDAARAFFRRMAADVAAGRRALLAGWVDGVLSGTVTLDLAMPPNQPHRAEVQKLLVHPAARRRGLARALMARAELAAREAGRTLLTLDTRAGDAAEPLYRALGWTEAGRIPGYAMNGDGSFHDALFFWKAIE